MRGVGRNSSVGTAAPYRLHGPGIRSRYGANYFPLVQTGSGSHRTSCTVSFSGMQLPIHDGNLPRHQAPSLKESRVRNASFKLQYNRSQKKYFGTKISNVWIGCIKTNLIRTKIIPLYKETFVQTLLSSCCKCWYGIRGQNSFEIIGFTMRRWI